MSYTPWLLPFAWLYGMGVGLRNKLFDWGILQSKSFCIPVVCVGNLSVGGTGKTPHTEYLIRLLQNEGLHIATLSRGYKRKTKGFLLATETSSAHDIGDEPYQMKQKFPDVRVAVDEDRCHGIEQLLKLTSPAIDVIILDDAYQHRYVKAGYNILLTDFHRPFHQDALMPAGRLRESSSGKRRADAVIVTKCPDNISSADYKKISDGLQLCAHQHLYFSTFRYSELRPLFAENSITTLSDKEVLLVTGIANPTPLLKQVQAEAGKVDLLAFPDHHDFDEKDMQLIEKRFMQLSQAKRIIVTTEKDAARLKSHPMLSNQLKPHTYVLPIEIAILQEKQRSFNQNIIDYVRKNSRNSHLPA